MKLHVRLVLAFVLLFAFISSPPFFAGQLTEIYFKLDGQAPGLYPLAVENAPGGGFLMSAWFMNYGKYGGMNVDLVLVRIDPEGKMLWERHIGASELAPHEEDYPFGVTRTSDNSYIVAVNSYHYIDPDYFYLWPRLVLVKIDDSGNVLWEKEYGEGSFAYKANELPDGNFMVAGGVYEHPGVDGTTSAIVRKIDQNGNIVWERKTTAEGESIYFQECSALSNSELIVWGSNRICKFDSSGNILWSKKTSETDEYIQSLLVGSSGDIFMCTALMEEPYYEPTRVRVFRYDGNGLFKWGKELIGGNNDNYFWANLLPRGASDICIFGVLRAYLASDGKTYEGVGTTCFDENGTFQDTYTTYNQPFKYGWIDISDSSVIGEDGSLAYCEEAGYNGLNQSCLIKTDEYLKVQGSCIGTFEVPLNWKALDSCELSEVADQVQPSETTPTKPDWYLYGIDIFETNAFCPLISRVNKLQNPFRLEILGQGFFPLNDYYNTLEVTIDGVKVPQTSVKSTERIIIKKDTALKNILPKGVPACIQVRVLNYHGEEHPSYKSNCFYFTR